MQFLILTHIFKSIKAPIEEIPTGLAQLVERGPFKAEVKGSSPLSGINIIILSIILFNIIKTLMNYFSSKLRALSSSGRAPALQAGGREFESHSVQYKYKNKSILITCTHFW